MSKELIEIVEAASDPATCFFYEWAGWSYDPKIETSDQGKMRCAVMLANAERHAKSTGMRYEWRVDPHVDSREFNSEKPYYNSYCCTIHRRDGVCVGSLGGIDFGRGINPKDSTYKRVVEAELACECYCESLNNHDAACRDIATV